MTHSLSTEGINELEKNQKVCADLPPVTYRATFKLHELESLIKMIKENDIYNPNESPDTTHHVCITLVREELDKIINNHSILGYENSLNSGNLKIFSCKKSNKEFTQLIPIITGCHAVLDSNRNHATFQFMKDKYDNIPFVRSGGEGTGLIPPPPSGGS